MTHGVFFGGSSESDDDEGDGWDIGLVPSPRRRHLNEALQTDDKDEALKKAMTTGNLSAVEELLNSGVSVESTFKFGWTPLMYAASVANVELMHILLDRGANASFDKDQYTVLMAACAARASEEQILKSVDLLLSRNANPNATCSKPSQVLHGALDSRKINRMWGNLLKIAQLDQEKKMTPLMYAAREGHPQVVALLAGHGSQINAQDESGYTALTWAARYGHKKVVFKLLELGADKSIQTKDGQTPGEIAKNNKHLELFSLLSLMATPFQGRFQNLIKEEAIQNLLKAVPDGHKISSYAALGDLEVFLHGLGLEHITELLKEREITLRQLLTMGKEDFIEIGIKDQRDQQKILDAAKELQVEEVNLGELSGVINVEFRIDLSKKRPLPFLSGARMYYLAYLLVLPRKLHLDRHEILTSAHKKDPDSVCCLERQLSSSPGKSIGFGMELFLRNLLCNVISFYCYSADEFLSFLVKLNKQCIHLTTAIQSAVNQFPTDAHKLVLEWSPPQSLARICEDLISSAEDLNGQASKLKKLVQELQDVQRDNPCRIQPLVEKRRWKKTFFKMAAVTLVGSGCFFFVSRLTLRIVRAQPESYLHLFL
ncbi:hypothetical protein JD844_027801 [Phrynosoma platyrhinos]|uniref:Ankyrin repeat, SAM and basic leucine zipper domain-containing protein 1 n=1 Tax=Phrynosoma platyrhinos TaxID=52577 RepID=A0ABQ7SH30_PHRPL|nr:hypothetical protein JD844_027801 [Phrynosoma platyrhinos]